ncbi:hypothetical protein AB0K09_02575 [Streptomyces sp. NPDC049577]|uniref:hypothetical protein n=1 Tax=Streptomyces sp. NPDC049577 TaxID=3155153 RepID=UPI0034366BDD
MSLDLQTAANKRMRRGLIILAAIAAVLAVIVVLLLAFGGGKKDDGKAPAPAPTHVGPSNPTEGSEDSYASPKSWVKLPEGKERSNGLPVRFPQTDEGAAAMAVALVRAGWSISPEEVEKAAGTYSVPEEAEAAKSMAKDSAAENRKAAGIPTSGPMPQDAAFNVIPIGVQWEHQDNTHVKVSVDVRIVMSSGTGSSPDTRLVSTSTLAVWTDGDWKDHSIPPGQQPKPADIGNPEFNSAGWKAIQEGDRR